MMVAGDNCDNRPVKTTNEKIPRWIVGAPVAAAKNMM
jgi:hypothetical protein